MFDLAFFQDEILIKSFENLSYDKDLFKTNEISYNHRDKQLIRKTEDYTMVIDLKEKSLYLNLSKNNYEGSISLYKSEVIENENIIKIVYQLDYNEPINRIIITRRENER